MKLKGRIISEGEARGEALVSSKPLSFYGDIDKASGLIIGRDSDIYGHTVTNKILILPYTRGSTVSAWVIYALKKRNLSPKAILLWRTADPVIASGCLISSIPLIDMVKPKPQLYIRSGDEVEVLSTGEIII
ncbi:MAG: DUF126 domain-containing protein [Candidatus Methanomethylicia archaeon]